MYKDLILCAGYVIQEMDASEPAKLQMWNFVKNEATEVQLKAFILDKDLVSLDEQSKEIVEDRFTVYIENQSVLNEAFEWAGVLYALRVKYTQDYKACVPAKCSTAKGLAKKLCTLQCEVAARNARIGEYKAGLGRCNDARSPKNCKNRFAKSIERNRNKAEKAKAKMAKLKSKRA